MREGVDRSPKQTDQFFLSLLKENQIIITLRGPQVAVENEQKYRLRLRKFPPMEGYSFVDKNVPANRIEL